MFGDTPAWSRGRRAFVFGASGLAVLAGSGAALFWPRRIAEQVAVVGQSWSFLLPADRIALARLTPYLLNESAGVGGSSGNEVLGETLLGIDRAIGLLPPAIRDELRQLFDLLSSPGGRMLFLGFATDWTEADGSAVANGLEGWQMAKIGLLRSAYEGLRDIVFAVWYGDPKHWGGLPDFGWKGL